MIIVSPIHPESCAIVARLTAIAARMHSASVLLGYAVLLELIVKRSQ